MKARLTLLGAAVLLATTPLAAQAEDSPFSANIALTSKYKYRGQDQSDTAKSVLPAVQGGFDFSSGGFYLGNWNSSIGWADTGTEMDFYGGYRGEAGEVSYDVGVLHYYYPGTTLGINTTEVYGSVGFGPVSAKYSRVVSSKWFGLDGGKGTGYFELNAGVEVASGVKLVAHVGNTQFSSGAKSNGAVNYTDYKLGADFDLGGGFTAGLAYVGATKKADWGDINKSRVVFTLSKAL